MIPVAKRTPKIDWRGVPPGLKGKVSAVCRSEKDCADLVHWFGDPNFCPFLPILLLIPGAPGQLAGLGLATAAELRDEAVARWQLMTRRLERIGRIVDFDTLREKHGLMRKEDVEPAFREALVERIRKHRRNPRTDPPRQPLYPRVNGRTIHAVGEKRYEGNAKEIGT